jgi:uroporphyrinogen III methyltransferase/synthase
MSLGSGKAVPANEAKPLLNRLIAITRARSQASEFARRIEELGGQTIEFPTIEIQPPNSYSALDAAIRSIATYHWIIFTSVNAVKYFWARFQHLHRKMGDLDGIRIAAIGPETAKELDSIGLRAGFVPREYRAEGLLQGLKAEEISGKRVLLPRAVEAREVLPNTLRGRGAEVDVVEAYRTAAAKSNAAPLREMLLQKKVDMITFTSSSTIVHFSNLFSDDDMKQLLAGAAVACIGPITQKTAEEAGIRVDVVARDYTIPGLTQAIVEFFKKDSRREAAGNK